MPVLSELSITFEMEASHSGAVAPVQANLQGRGQDDWYGKERPELRRNLNEMKQKAGEHSSIKRGQF